MIKIPTEPSNTKGITTFFELLGSNTERVRELVERFYDIMDSDPRAAGIRALHAVDLTSAREKLFMFLTGWMGGPQLYITRYGHPFLRKRHLPFAIGESERDQWMYCMIKAMNDIGLAESIIGSLSAALWDVADFMRNQPE
jgi:hemoglobin